jgi:AraC-like DNA-binding protein
MALIAALLPDPVDREALRRAASKHDLHYVDSWKDLAGIVRRLPITGVVADLHAEPRKDGVLRIFRLGESFPHTPILAWGDLDGRDLYRLGKAGAADVILSRDADNVQQVAEIIHPALGNSVPRLIDVGLLGQIEDEARALVHFAAEQIPNRIQVPDLALAYNTSVSTLERRCERWGIPTPGRLLLWLRVLYGLRWLAEPGRSLESIADQLGYSSGAAFRRAIQATIGVRGAPLRTYRSFHAALNRFLGECPGIAAQRPPHVRV